VFSIVFGIFGRFGIVAVCPRASAIEIRPPAVGLLEQRALDPSMTTLVVALLATVTFDGFLETPLWAQLDLRILDVPPDSSLWTILKLSEAQALRLGRTIGLLTFVALFNAVYYVFCQLIAAVTKRTRADVTTIAGRFVLSLVPISIAYHIAHYFSYLAIGGQYIIPSLSDPLGRGSDLFGTAAYQPNVGIVGPWLQWSVAWSPW
jgi:ABC-type transport system involved in multi-copper enzyme maturation permease subunit